MFNPPEGRAPYAYVFDLTGEVRHDRPDMVRLLRNTLPPPSRTLFAFLIAEKKPNPWGWLADFCCGNFGLQIQIGQTVNIARLLGEEAAQRGVKAYVRITQAFYDTPEKGTHDEKESIKPAGVRGVWWHETLRVLADIEKYVLKSIFFQLLLTARCGVRIDLLHLASTSSSCGPDLYMGRMSSMG